MTDREKALADFELLLDVLNAHVLDGRTGWGKKILGIKSSLRTDSQPCEAVGNEYCWKHDRAGKECQPEHKASCKEPCRECYNAGFNFANETRTPSTSKPDGAQSGEVALAIKSVCQMSFAPDDYMAAAIQTLITAAQHKPVEVTVEELLDLLFIMYDGHENGDPCFEYDNGEQGGFLGNAFILGDAPETRICELLNKYRPRIIPEKETT